MPASGVPQAKRPLWRRLLPWLTLLTVVPFVCLAVGVWLSNHFQCQISGDPPHGPPCIAHGVDIEPTASFLEDTGEGVLLTIFTIPVIAVGWVAVAVQSFQARQRSKTSPPPGTSSVAGS